METAGTALFIDKPKRDKFFKAAEKLWEGFEKSVEKRAKDLGIKVTIGEGVFAKAVAMSGEALVRNINCFDDNGDEVEAGKYTSTCANYCAEVATDYVKGDADPKIITPTHFENAWYTTRAKYEARKCQIEDLHKQTGTEKKPGRGRGSVAAYGC
jgi:hypothetical protein